MFIRCNFYFLLFPSSFFVFHHLSRDIMERRKKKHISRWKYSVHHVKMLMVRKLNEIFLLSLHFVRKFVPSSITTLVIEGMKWKWGRKRRKRSRNAINTRKNKRKERSFMSIVIQVSHYKWSTHSFSYILRTVRVISIKKVRKKRKKFSTRVACNDITTFYIHYTLFVNVHM